MSEVKDTSPSARHLSSFHTSEFTLQKDFKMVEKVIVPSLVYYAGRTL